MARLKSGDEVLIKIQHNGIEQVIRQDLLLTDLPRDLSLILQTVRSGRLHVRHEHPGLEKAIDRGVQGILTAALFLGSTQLLSQKIPPTLAEVSLPGMVGLVLGILLGLWVLRTMKKAHENHQQG